MVFHRGFKARKMKHFTTKVGIYTSIFDAYFATLVAF